MAAATPLWKAMKGEKRIVAEMRALSKVIKAEPHGQLHDLQPVGDSTFKWRVQVKNFDNDTPGGRQLNEDLSLLNGRCGMDHLLVELQFPTDYPTQPFLLRVVAPRCQWYTGHVTAGGSICMETLTTSGCPGSWQPDFSVESVLRVVLVNLIDCEEVEVRTATGPGGRSGPLRIDLDGRWHHCSVTTPYSEAEARSAYQRMLQHHQRNGWGSTPAPPPPAAATTPPRAAGPAVTTGGSHLPGSSGAGPSAQHPTTLSAPTPQGNVSDSPASTRLLRHHPGRQQQQLQHAAAPCQVFVLSDTEDKLDETEDDGTITISSTTTSSSTNGSSSREGRCERNNSIKKTRKNSHAYSDFTSKRRDEAFSMSSQARQAVLAQSRARYAAGVALKPAASSTSLLGEVEDMEQDNNNSATNEEEDAAPDVVTAAKALVQLMDDTMSFTKDPSDLLLLQGAAAPNPMLPPRPKAGATDITDRKRQRA